MPSPSPKPVDFDALFGPAIRENVETTPVYEFTFGGRVWHAADCASAAAGMFAFNEQGDVNPAKIQGYILGFLIEEEQADFEKLLTGMRGLDGEVFGKLLDAIYGLVTGRPTEPPTGSPSPPAPKSGRNSKASLSSAVVAV